MSTSAWIRRQRDRPLAEHERRAAMATVLVLVAVTVPLLALTAPGNRSHAAASTPSVAPRRLQTPLGSSTAVPLTGTAERAAALFLNSYLGYLYGRSRASEVKGASSVFTHSLRERALRVPPSMRSRRPRVVALHRSMAPAGLIGVTAVVNDGGLVDYPIALRLAREGGGLLVTGLSGA